MWAWACICLLSVPGFLAAQGTSAAEHPVVRSVAFEGLKQFDADDILATLVTQPTTCRSFILQPFCLVIHTPLFENVHHLDRTELPRDELRIEVYAWLRGYRHTRARAEVRSTYGGVHVVFHVSEGPPTLIRSQTVQQTRPVLSEKQIHQAGLPGDGRPIDLTAVDSARARLRRMLWDRGRADAVVQDTARLVDSLGVALEVRIEPGPPTTVDTVEVQGNRKVSSLTIHRLFGLSRGDSYKRSDVLAGQRRLYRSELFRQALISVPDSADSAKRVLVRVVEAPEHGVHLGAGLSTAEFVQLEAGATFYNWLGSARRLEISGAMGNLFASALYGQPGFGSSVPSGVSGHIDPAFLRPTWQLSTTVTQPWLFAPLNSGGLSVFAHRRSIPDIVIDDGAGGSLTFTRQLLRTVPVSLTYRYERTRIEAGDLYFCVDFGYCRIPTIDALQGYNGLAPLVLSAHADATDDALDPTTGYSASLDAEYASSATASDWHYDRIESQVTRYIRLGGGVLVLHADAGRVAALGGTLRALGLDTSSAALLHPRERFYAGGARSVRGYGEGQLGPRVLTIDPQKLLTPSDTTQTPCTQASLADGSCDPNIAPASDFVPRPVGGSSLLEGTIEYRHPVVGPIGLALFVDAGRVGAADLPPGFHARSAITPGFGVRYASPVGPVRVDLGIRPVVVEDLPVATQVRDSTGVLRLVQLSTPKRYDPFAVRHGFLGPLTSRLELHLYIGEGY